MIPTFEQAVRHRSNSWSLRASLYRINRSMTDQDTKEIKESLEGKTPWVEKKEVTSMNEAPASTTIKAYYQGFSVLFTKRNMEGKISPLNTRVFIDDIIKKGYKPSWNTETNKQNGESEDLGNCDKCGAPNKRSMKGKVYCSKTCWLKK